MTSVLPISGVGVEDELIVARSAQIPQKQSVMIFNRRQYPRFEYMECVDTAVVRSACSELYWSIPQMWSVMSRLSAGGSC